MATYLSDNSYLAIKPEATAGTPVIPTIFVPLVSDTIKTIVNYNADRRMKGLSWKSDDLLRGNRSHEGDIVVLADADALGHMLNMVLAIGSTTGNAGIGYTHPFTVGTAKTYTIEIKKGLYVQRYYGVTVDKLKLDFTDGQLQATISVKCMGQVSIGSVGVALTGAGMTSLVMDDEYDIAPNRGLVAGDVINIDGTDVTLLTVNANGTTVTFASTSITASVGATVYLVPQTVSMPVYGDPLYFGNLFAGFADTAANAATAASARSTATPIYDLSIELSQNLFAANGSNRMDPVQIVTQTKEAQVMLKMLFTSAAQRQAWLDRTKQAMVLSFWGKFIDTAMTIQENFVLTLNKVKAIDEDNEIKVGELIVDNQKFEVLYDAGDAQALAATLVNRSAGTVY